MSTLYASSYAPSARQQAPQRRQGAAASSRSPQRQASSPRQASKSQCQASGAVGPGSPSPQQSRQPQNHQSQTRRQSQPQSQPQSQQLPDPGRWAGTVAVYAWEIMHGMRQPQHLARWLTPELYDALSRRAQVAARCQAGKPARIPYLYAVRAQASASGWEVSVLLSHDGRIHACACQIQLRHGHWVMTYLHMG
jgi:hypothetical protein